MKLYTAWQKRILYEEGSRSQNLYKHKYDYSYKTVYNKDSRPTLV